MRQFLWIIALALGALMPQTLFAQVPAQVPATIKEPERLQFKNERVSLLKDYDKLRELAVEVAEDVDCENEQILVGSYEDLQCTNLSLHIENYVAAVVDFNQRLYVELYDDLMTLPDDVEMLTLFHQVPQQNNGGSALDGLKAWLGNMGQRVIKAFNEDAAGDTAQADLMVQQVELEVDISGCFVLGPTACYDLPERYADSKAVVTPDQASSIFLRTMGEQNTQYGKVDAMMAALHYANMTTVMSDTAQGSFSDQLTEDAKWQASFDFLEGLATRESPLGGSAAQSALRELHIIHEACQSGDVPADACQ